MLRAVANLTLGGNPGTFTSVTVSGLTAGRVVYTDTGGLLSASANLLFDGTDFSALNPITVGTNDTTAKIIAGGSNTNLTLAAAGASGELSLNTASTVRQVLITHTASAVNWVRVTGSATGQPSVVGVGGSDTDIDLLLDTKGSGLVWMGTHSAVGAETVTGFITIRDKAGNTRKLAVLS